MADEETYGRKPVVVAEMIQPRCSHRFGIAGPSDVTTATASPESGDTITTANYDTAAPFVAEFNVTFDASPVGIICEIGGFRGFHLGVTSGDLILHAGPGAPAANYARVSTPASAFASGTYRIIAEIKYATNTVRLTVFDTNGVIVFTGSDTASSGFGGDWAGFNNGAVGRLEVTTIVGLTAANWNGTVTSADLFDDLEIDYTFGCAATGTPKCYQTYWTCLNRDNYNADGSISWRFSRPGDEVGWLYEETDANNIKTNAIPILKSISATSSRINPGVARAAESPLGTRAKATATFSDGVWDDHVGDFYLSDRSGVPNRGFWSLYEARNIFSPGVEMVLYYGYEGQALSAMVARRFNVEAISGPGSGDTYQVSCRDPLDDLRGKNAKYPPTSQIDLAADIDDTETSIGVVCLEAQLSLDLGNTGDTRYLVIGDEAISYTGWTGTAPEFTLTGVTRGVLGTAADSHSAEDAAQRGARHVNQRLYNVARYIIEDHTTVKASYIDGTQWDNQGRTYLSTLLCDTFLPEPEPVEKLLGELSRDGMFLIYWDERQQKIPLLAISPPQSTPIVITDSDNIIGFSKKESPDQRMTRVSYFFKPRNFLDDLNKPKNYENRRIRIDAEVENPLAAGGKIFENAIYSRWARTFGNALLVGSALLQRYRLPPEYATLDLDAKDRALEVGDVIDLETRYILDSEGNPVESRWQIIGLGEPRPGHSVQAELQSYSFFGKFAVIMENDAPDYVDATASERLNGCWIAENTGLMPDGSDPYLLQ